MTMIRKTRSDKGKRHKPFSVKERAEIGGLVGLGVGSVGAGINEYLELKDKLTVINPKLGTKIPNQRLKTKLTNNVKRKVGKRLIRVGKWAMTKRIGGKALAGAAVGVVLGRELGTHLLKPRPDYQKAVVRLNAYGDSTRKRKLN